MGKSSAPPPIDPVATANAQAAANKSTSLFNTNLNRTNQVNPNGSTSWTLRPGADPNNPQPGDYVQTVSLSPVNQQFNDTLNNTALDSLGRVSSVMGTAYDPSGLPGQQSGVNTGGFQQLNAGTTGGRDAVIQAMNNQIQPQLDNRRQTAETGMLNSGIEKGTDAWNRGEDQLARDEATQRDATQLAGGQEQSRQAALEASTRGQQFGEGLSNATFSNESRAQQMQQQLQLRDLPLNEVDALRSGAVMNSPNFGGYYTGGSAGAPDIAGLTQTAQQQQQAAVNASNANSASTAGAGVSALSSVAMLAMMY